MTSGVHLTSIKWQREKKGRPAAMLHVASMANSEIENVIFMMHKLCRQQAHYHTP
jgi:hypothetical protein